MKAFLIFEGGGAKGLAHIGALKAAEQRGIEPAGVAGASAGSIVAALVAAGYTADDLYDLGKAGRGLLDRFLGKATTVEPAENGGCSLADPGGYGEQVGE